MRGSKVSNSLSTSALVIRVRPKRCNITAKRTVNRRAARGASVLNG